MTKASLRKDVIALPLPYPPVRRYLFLAVLFLVGMTSYMDRNILPILLEPIKKEFAIPDRTLGLLVGAPFALAFALSSIPLGVAADRLGRKPVLLGSLVVWTVMTGACGLAATLPMLFIARMGVGLGEGGANPPAHALIAEYFPREQRSAAFAIFTAASIPGATIAAVLGAWLAQLYGWRAGFLGMAAISVPIALAALIVLREPPARSKETEARQATAQALRQLLAKPSYALILLGGISYSMIPYGPILFVPSYLVRVFGLSLAMAGGVFGTSAAIGTVLGGIAAVTLPDRLIARDVRWSLRLPAFGLLLCWPIILLTFSVGSVTLFAVGLSLSVAILFVSLPPMLSAVQMVCGDDKRALSAAVVFTTLNAIGLTAAPFLTGLLSDAFAAAGALSIRYAFLIMSSSALMSAAFFLAAARRLNADIEPG